MNLCSWFLPLFTPCLVAGALVALRHPACLLASTHAARRIPMTTASRIRDLGPRGKVNRSSPP